eukprot:6492295-Amphidinium_carterae.1
MGSITFCNGKKPSPKPSTNFTRALGHVTMGTQLEGLAFAFARACSSRCFLRYLIISVSFASASVADFAKVGAKAMPRRTPEALSRPIQYSSPSTFIVPLLSSIS